MIKKWFIKFIPSFVFKLFHVYPYNFGSYAVEHLNWFDNNEIKKKIYNFSKGDYDNYKDRHFNLINLLKLIRRLYGDTIEFGVFQGKSSYLILDSLKGKNFSHHCVDSFKGLSKPKKKDLNINAPHYWKKGDLSCSLKTVTKNLSEFKNVKYYEGFIPKILSKLNKNNKYRFVHFDLDLSFPTKCGLKKIYNNVIPGGIILFDDYGFNSCKGVKFEVDKFFKNKKEKIIELSSGQAFILKV